MVNYNLMAVQKVLKWLFKTNTCTAYNQPVIVYLIAYQSKLTNPLGHNLLSVLVFINSLGCNLILVHVLISYAKLYLAAT